MSVMAKKLRSTYEWLEQYLNVQQEIRLLEWNLRRTKLELSRWRDGDLQHVETNEHSKSSHLEETITELQRQIDEDKELLSQLDELVNTFDDTISQVVYLHHCKGMTLEEVAEAVGYSYGQTRKYHAEAIKSMNFLDKFGDVLAINKRNRKNIK